MITSNSSDYNEYVVDVYYQFINEPKYIPNKHDLLFLQELKKIAVKNNPIIQNIAIAIKTICEIIRTNSKFNNDTYVDAIKNLFSRDFIQHLDSLIFTYNFSADNVECGDMMVYKNTLHDTKTHIDIITTKLKVTMFGCQFIDDLLVKINYNLLLCKENILQMCKLVNKWFMDNNYCDLSEARLENANYDMELTECIYLYSGNNSKIMTPKKRKVINIVTQKIDNIKEI